MRTAKRTCREKRSAWPCGGEGRAGRACRPSRGNRPCPLRTRPGENRHRDRGAFPARQPANVLGGSLDLVHEAASPIGPDEDCYPPLVKRGPQLVEMFRAGQDGKLTVLPGVVDGSGIACRGDQRRDQNVRVEHHAHQALPGVLVRRSARTSPTASSTMRWIARGSAPALPALMS